MVWYGKGVSKRRDRCEISGRGEYHKFSWYVSSLEVELSKCVESLRFGEGQGTRKGSC